MLDPPANSSSVATSGAFSHPATAPATRARRRVSSRSRQAEENEEAPVDVPPSNGETCCSLGNEQGGEAVSPLREGLASLKSPKPPGKGVRGGSSSRSGGQTQLVGPVVSKSLFVVVLLALVATTFWNWNSARSRLPELSSAIQLKELEDFSRKTTKWIQVQLELVDMKIGKEIGGLRREMEEKMEEQSMVLGTSIKNLKAQVEGLDTSLQKLIQQGLLSKKEGVELVMSVIQQRFEEDSARPLSLDDVRAAARQIVEAELDKHSADGIGRADYALGSGGGKVIDHSEGFFSGTKTSWLRVLGAGLSAGGAVKHPMAYKVLEPSYGEPGQCLPLKGSDVYVDIALRTHIHPDAVTIEHVPRSVAYDVKSAPKDFRVFGWLEHGIHADTIANPVKKRLLGEFTYSVDGPNIQTFSFPKEDQQQVINTVRVHVTSNHGSPSHTCIYRIRIHGSEPVSELGSQS